MAAARSASSRWRPGPLRPAPSSSSSGAKYLGDLLAQFDGDPYKAAAAYNAGPKQARLWARMAPAPGDDHFLSAVNFDETKNYVRKVLNSYERYGEIYESGPPSGGIRPEP